MNIVLIVIFFVIWFVVIYFFSPKLKENKHTAISINEILSIVDNGDLLFLSGETFPEKAIKTYTRSPYSHVGLIFLDLNKKNTKIIPYLWEADVGGRRKDGPRIIKLKTKLEHPGKGRTKVAMIKFLKAERPKTTDILKSVKRNVNRTMDDLMISWLFSYWPYSTLFKLSHDENKVFCSELVAQTLIDCRLLDENVHPSYYSPELLRKQEIYGKEIFVNLLF
jgi:hypothetical protein